MSRIIPFVPANIFIRIFVNGFSLLNHFLSDYIESGIYALSSFSRYNVKVLIISITKSFDISQIKFFIQEIYFVDQKKFLRFGVSMLTDFIPPKIFYVIERFFRAKFTADKNCVNTTVISCCQCTESLLACGVPKLNFDFFIIDGFGFEFLRLELEGRIIT
jgi:hypothetical protein